MADAPKADTAEVHRLAGVIHDQNPYNTQLDQDRIAVLACRLANERDTLRAALQAGPKVKLLVWADCTVDGEIEDRAGNMLHPVPAIVSGQYQITRQYYNDGLWVLKTPDGKGQIASRRIADTKERAQIHHNRFILSALEPHSLNPNGGEQP